jgi:hypothetical protein
MQAMAAIARADRGRRVDSSLTAVAAAVTFAPTSPI